MTKEQALKISCKPESKEVSSASTRRSSFNPLTNESSSLEETEG